MNLERLSSSVFEHRHQIIGQCFGIRSRDGRNHQECRSPRELRESKSRDFPPIKSLEERKSSNDQKLKSFSRSRSLPKNLPSNSGDDSSTSSMEIMVVSRESSLMNVSDELLEDHLEVFDFERIDLKKLDFKGPPKLLASAKSRDIISPCKNISHIYNQNLTCRKSISLTGINLMKLKGKRLSQLAAELDQ